MFILLGDEEMEGSAIVEANDILESTQVEGEKSHLIVWHVSNS